MKHHWSVMTHAGTSFGGDAPISISTIVLMTIVGVTIAMAPPYEAAIYVVEAASVTMLIVLQPRSCAVGLVLGVMFGLAARLAARGRIGRRRCGLGAAVDRDHHAVVRRIGGQRGHRGIARGGELEARAQRLDRQLLDLDELHGRHGQAHGEDQPDDGHAARVTHTSTVARDD
jgi:hypothetical protein